MPQTDWAEVISSIYKFLVDNPQLDLDLIYDEESDEDTDLEHVYDNKTNENMEEKSVEEIFEVGWIKI